MGSDAFRDWVRAREDGGSPDLDEHLARAGAERDDVARRIAAYERVFALATRVVDERRAAEPRTLADFEILGSIGQGGLSKVWLANDRELSRKVALKELDVPAELAPNQRDWVRNEARSLAQLTHPGVVRVFQLATDRENERDWLVMELLAGPTLGRVIAALRAAREEPEGPEPDDPLAAELAVALRSWRARVRCLAELASALAYCHGRGILHRDVKPNNVILAEDGAPKLIDFGLAHIQNAQEETKLDITQRLVGAPAYVAPEQVENDRTGADPKSDQFSFGVVAYELLTLRNPFARATRSQTLDAIAHARPPAPRKLAPELSADLERVLLHMLERDPAARYPDLTAAADDLRAVLEHRPVSVRPPSLGHRAGLLLRRHRARVVALLVALAALALLVLTGALVAGWTGRASVHAALTELGRAGADSAEQLMAQGQELRELEKRARDLDETPLLRLMGAVSLDVARVARSWSMRVHEAADRSRSSEHADTEDVTRWLAVLDLEQRIWPDCPDETNLHGTRRVQLPAEIADLEFVLSRQTRAGGKDAPAEAYTRFIPVEPEERLPPGYYRLQAWRSPNEAPTYQFEFLVQGGWAPESYLHAAEPDPLAYERAMHFDPRTWLETLGGSGPESRTLTLAVLPFRLSRALVTLGEFERFLAATHAPAPQGLAPAGASPDTPVAVTLANALAFAAWSGARLPSVVELALGAREGAFDPSVEDPFIYCEWVSDIYFRFDTAGVAVHAALATHIANPTRVQLVSTMAQAPKDGIVRSQESERSRGSGFRLAWSTEPLR